MGQALDEIKLRLARLDDAVLLYQWRNDPQVRQNAFNQEIISLDSHQEWFLKKLEDSKTQINIILNNKNTPIGQIRFDQDGNKEAIVTISLIPLSQGKGLGVRALKQASAAYFQAVGVQAIKAYIKKDNLQSLMCFDRAGFKRQKSVQINGNESEEMVLLRSRPGDENGIKQ